MTDEEGAGVIVCLSLGGAILYREYIESHPKPEP
jgi:hypothetical protein